MHDFHTVHFLRFELRGIVLDPVFRLDKCRRQLFADASITPIILVVQNELISSPTVLTLILSLVLISTELFLLTADPYEHEQEFVAQTHLSGATLHCRTHTAPHHFRNRHWDLRACRLDMCTSYNYSWYAAVLWLDCTRFYLQRRLRDTCTESAFIRSDNLVIYTCLFVAQTNFCRASAGAYTFE